MVIAQQSAPSGTLWCRLLGHKLTGIEDSPVEECERCEARYYPYHDMWLSGDVIRRCKNGGD